MAALIPDSMATATADAPVISSVSTAAGEGSPVDHEVIVVGAGSTGAAAAYHLVAAGVTDVLVLEQGTPGRGRPTGPTVVAPVTAGIPKATPDDETEYLPAVSGTAVFNGGSDGPTTIKMIVALPPYHVIEDFADHHGWDGVKTYLEAAVHGRDLEVTLAQSVLPKPEAQVRRLGSLMVAAADAADRLKLEYDQLRAVGFTECEWWDADKVAAVHGAAAEFVAGIWFPNDAIIDSSTFAQSLLKAAATKSGGKCVLRSGCTPVAHVGTEGDIAVVRFQDGSVLRCRHAIVATGGMYLDEHLSGILTPCFSYLAALPHRAPPTSANMTGGMAAHCSPNYFTFGFSHDWAVSDGWVRISGEDHYSGLKAPRWKQRCGRLAEWGHAKYPFLDSSATYSTRYGIYSETPDHMPVVGTPNDKSKVLYMVGCNAWGQASMSAAAHLAPAFLGLRPFTPFERRVADLFSIRRFCGKLATAAPAVPSKL